MRTQQITNTDSTQIATLRVLANKCPFTDGIAVYQARVLLAPFDSIGTIYTDACDAQTAGRPTDALEIPVSITRLIKVYPNPATSQLTVSYTTEASDNAVFEIYNLVGKKISTTPLNTANNMQSMDVSGLNAGVYFYTYSLNNLVLQTGKVIIVK